MFRSSHIVIISIMFMKYDYEDAFVGNAATRDQEHDLPNTLALWLCVTEMNGSV